MTSHARQQSYRGAQGWIEPVLWGRERALALVLRFVTGPVPAGPLWVCGPPGMGKRAVVAHALGLCSGRQPSDPACATGSPTHLVRPDGLLWLDLSPNRRSGELRRAWRGLAGPTAEACSGEAASTQLQRTLPSLDLLVVGCWPDAAAATADPLLQLDGRCRVIAVCSEVPPPGWRGQVLMVAAFDALPPPTLWWRTVPAPPMDWPRLVQAVAAEPWAVALLAAQLRNLQEQEGDAGVAGLANRLLRAGHAGGAVLLRTAWRRCSEGAQATLHGLVALGGCDAGGWLADVLVSADANQALPELSAAGLVQVRHFLDAPFTVAPVEAFVRGHAAHADWTAAVSRRAAEQLCAWAERPYDASQRDRLAPLLPLALADLQQRGADDALAVVLVDMGPRLAAAGLGDAVAHAAEQALAQAQPASPLVAAAYWSLARLAEEPEVAAAWYAAAKPPLPAASGATGRPRRFCKSRFADLTASGAPDLDSWMRDDNAAPPPRSAPDSDAALLTAWSAYFPAWTAQERRAAWTVESATVDPHADRGWAVAQTAAAVLATLPRKDDQGRYHRLLGQVAAKANQWPQAAIQHGQAALAFRAVDLWAHQAEALTAQAGALAAAGNPDHVGVRAEAAAVAQRLATVGDPLALRDRVRDALHASNQCADQGNTDHAREHLHAAVALCRQLGLGDGEPPLAQALHRIAELADA